MIKLNNIKTIIIIGAICGFLGTSCGSNQSKDIPQQAVISSASLLEMSDEILKSLKSSNWEKVSEYFHPTEGVRFSPYSYINTVTDICLTKEEFLDLTKSDKELIWGVYDGTGDTIRATINQYLNKFILDKNYDTVEDISLNNYIHHGSSLDNLREIYPQADVVEYFVPGSEEYAQMDWGQLKLIFKSEDNRYYLIGVVRNVWTT